MNIPGDFWELCLQDQDGRERCMKEFRGKWIVLYFYPKDNTPGCTREAVSFSKLMPKFKALSAVVVGVSRDSLRSHANFALKHGLSVILLSDPEGLLHEMFSVLKEVERAGKRRKKTVRSTFLISPSGEVVREWRNVRVDGHAQEVLETLQKFVGGKS